MNSAELVAWKIGWLFDVPAGTLVTVVGSVNTAGMPGLAPKSVRASVTLYGTKVFLGFEGLKTTAGFVLGAGMAFNCWLFPYFCCSALMGPKSRALVVHAITQTGYKP